jgi:predicted metal-dependent enzyme (double-stranded beta helix superfamily)
MQVLRVPVPECQSWLAALFMGGASVSESVLGQIAADLTRLGNELDWNRIQAPAAEPGEERVYLLAQAGQDGPSLYRVSDGLGVTSPAHEHKTWAVIVGLSGIEGNAFYEATSHGAREARHVRARNIGPGDRIVLMEAAIHSTEVVGTQATFHLHLYGKPLHALPPFDERVFHVPAGEA